jgi:hypothetical protein
MHVCTYARIYTGMYELLLLLLLFAFQHIQLDSEETLNNLKSAIKGTKTNSVVFSPQANYTD